MIPISGFYEWNQEKEKYRCIPQNNEKILYLAGIYSRSGKEPRFTIITTTANEIMKTVHDRMPVVLHEKTLLNWLTSEDDIRNEDRYSFQLQREKKREEYQQISFL